MICDKTKGEPNLVKSRRQFSQVRHESAFVIPTLCAIFVGAKIHIWYNGKTNFGHLQTLMNLGVLMMVDLALSSGSYVVIC